MTLLHACILLRDFKSFQRLLNIHGRSNQADDRQLKGRRIELSDIYSGDTFRGGGLQRSPIERSPPKHAGRNHHAIDDATTSINVNEKDMDGRTALHLACSLLDCSEYVRLLLKHPSINVNLYDAESHYTPLHRAILLLLQRPDIDVTLKDYEGYTPFDLYNSTIEGTKPDISDPDGELFMWGTNLNAILGFSDGNNRTSPDQIVIQPKEYATFPPEGPTLADRFSPINVRQIGMSKLHTVVVTSESGSDCKAYNVCGGNLRVCGYGSSGRLGPSPYHHSQQYILSSLPPHAFVPNVQVTKVAVGQDHTLALTKSGEVYSWGLNRFAQLGYVIRAPQNEPGSSATGPSSQDDRNDVVGKGGGSSMDDTVQQTPRRVLDALRKEIVDGVVASKMASACWTSRGDLFTWGTNSGQLGYERSSYPQVFPRKVSKLVGQVIDVALSDMAMACLVSTGDVICVWNDKEIKINFPVQTFPAATQPYRPPQALRDAGIAKLTCCDDAFAALSLSGEVFVFTAPDSSATVGEPMSAGRTALIKPQRAWILKKKYRAVKDVALGTNGNIIVCTESGHVFVRTRAPPAKVSSDKAAGGGTSSSITGPGTSFSTMATAASTAQSGKLGTNFTFVRVPCLQRITKVCANSTGAFGALRVDYRHAPIEVMGNGVAEDLRELMPFAAMAGVGSEEWQNTKKGGRFGLDIRKNSLGGAPSTSPYHPSGEAEADDADFEDVRGDILQLKHICDVIGQEKKGRKGQKDSPKDRRLPFDADVTVVSQSDAAFPAHRVILAARSAQLCNILAGGKAVKDDKTSVSVRFSANKGKSTLPSTSRPVKSSGKLMISGCHVLSILLLLSYLYSDELLAIWDPRIKTEMQQECARLKVKPDQVKMELKTLARLLDLPLLVEVLDLWIKRAPRPSMARDMETLWSIAQSDTLHGQTGPLAPDVILQLADREVCCHSVLLCARSDLFAGFFGEEVWTMDRWNDQGVIRLDMQHLKWHTMQYVLRFMFCGAEEAQFDRLDFANTVDEVLDFMFSVMAAATELLLDRLVLVCSTIILKYTNIQNACYILNDATHYNAKQLIGRVQTYILVNLETMLEQRILDDLPHRLVKQLAVFARRKQAEKSPWSRTTVLVDAAMAKHAEWISLLDVPTPIIQLNRPQERGVNVTRKRSQFSLEPPIPTIASDSDIGIGLGMSRPSSGDDIFMMDDAEGPSVTVESPPKSLGWKPHSMPRVDMKLLMAEEAVTSSVSLSRKAPLPVSRTGSRDSITPATPSPGSSVPRSSNTSWRVPALGKAALLPVTGAIHNTTTPHKQQGAPPGTSPREAHIPTAAKVQTSTINAPSRSSSSHPQSTTEKEGRSTVGLIITPTRQSSKTTTNSPSIRRVSGKAWALPPVEPVIATSPPLSTAQAATSGVSFVAIQQLQLEQASGPSKEKKKSLREIQAEEEARQQEQDFLRWWAEEEERMRLKSEAALSRAMVESSNSTRVKGSGKTRPGKSTKNARPAAVVETRDPTAAERTNTTENRRAKPRIINQPKKQGI